MFASVSALGVRVCVRLCLRPHCNAVTAVSLEYHVLVTSRATLTKKCVRLPELVCLSAGACLSVFVRLRLESVDGNVSYFDLTL